MALHEKHLEDMVARYVRNGDTIAVGACKHGEALLKKLALHEEEHGIKVKIVPTSLKLAEIASSFGMRITSLNEDEVDTAIEFADAVDEHYNYIKRDSYSLVRDKMIAQSAETLVVVADEKDYGKKLRGSIPFEIATFGWKHTLSQLQAFGKAKIRHAAAGHLQKTETNHYIVDVDCDALYSPEDLEYGAKEIPGVLETGLFLGYADRLILHNHKVRVESRG